MKNNSTIVVVPSSAVEPMGLGTITGLTSITNAHGNQGFSDAEKVEVPRKPNVDLEGSSQ